MDSWSIVILAAAGSMGVLAFLRVVANEIALQNRLIEVRQEAEQDEYRRERRRKASGPPPDAEDAPITTVMPVEDAA